MFDNSYARLPDRFYAFLNPTPVAAPKLLKVNAALASKLGFDADSLTTVVGLEVLAGNQVPTWSQPLAMAYAGHQFGSWNPQLGDGRAILLGEVLDRNGVRHDVQLKGAGRTPFSRMGDGRAWLGPVIREYVVSEAMAAMGVETTRALAAVSTGESIAREGMMPGAVLTRVARGHIRVGTFEYFASRQDEEGLKALADHVIDRFYPELRRHRTESIYADLLLSILDKQIALIASWQWLGFVHGVMNTDNMSISGETIDYGPCAFLDEYASAKVFSSIDRNGRYAYRNQPRIGQWNLAVLAQTLLPLIDKNSEKAVARAQTIIDSFAQKFQITYEKGMRRKLGLDIEQPEDLLLGSELLELMESSGADFTLTFRALAYLSSDNLSLDESTLEHWSGKPQQELARAPLDKNFSSTDAELSFRALFKDKAAIDQWLSKWRLRLQYEEQTETQRQERMKMSSPAVIPRNHRVEQAIQSAVANNYAPFELLLAATAQPYKDLPEFAEYREPPQLGQRVSQTFCGT